tara:strand:+ start:523 stop:696 length:174 start_codon:yes stop_codon:yes gene_type:complete
MSDTFFVLAHLTQIGLLVFSCHVAAGVEQNTHLSSGTLEALLSASVSFDSLKSGIMN